MRYWLLGVIFGCLAGTAVAYLLLFGLCIFVSFITLDFSTFEYVAREMSWLGFRCVVVVCAFVSVIVFSGE